MQSNILQLLGRAVACIQRRLWYFFCPDAVRRWREMNLRLDNLEHIIDMLQTTNDITKIPRANGAMRIVQLANTALLLEITSLFNKHHIPYWLSSGTLMGAVRHGGFIPWDDDIDICSTREYHSRIVDIIAEEYGNNGDVYAVKGDCIRIYKKGTPCQIDVFAWDILSLPDDSAATLEKAEALHREFNMKIQYDIDKLYQHQRAIVSHSDEEILRMTDKFVSSFKGEYKILVEGIEESHRNFFHWDYDVVFPLKTIIFEGKSFSCPNNPDALLWEIYGDYMTYPKTLSAHYVDYSKMKYSVKRTMELMIRDAGL